MSSKLSIPNTVRHSVEQMIDGKISKAEPLSGGCSFPTFAIQCKGEDFFLKFSDSNTEVFVKEAHGLAEISSQSKITPEVYVANNNCLLLEYLPPRRPTIQFWENLAQNLAELHKAKKNQYGFHEDNFIGPAIQHNLTPEEKTTWFDFFWNYRITPMLDQAKLKHDFRLDSETLKQIKFKTKQELSSYEAYPTIVHGDLWNGNIHCGEDQKAFLLDPAVYYGDREVDLAMTQLFGGFSENFYEVYNEILPLEKGHERRKVIYNLYHILNHYNLFGSSYKKSLLNSLEQIRNF